MKFAALASVTLSSLAIFLFGCASSPRAGEGPHHPQHGHEHGDQEHGHERGGKEHGHHMEGGMKDFHDVLAPAYHMDKGPARDEKACAGVGAMKAAATKIAAEPKGDAADHKIKADALSQTVGGLETACGAAGRADVAVKLELVHDAFHGLMKRHDGKHEKH